MDFKLTKWRVENIDFGSAKKELIRDDRLLFYLISTASFVEITSDLYTNNLINKYGGKSEELAKWLESVWEFEELQHGKALKAYVEYVWPEFDWNGAYRGFFEEYSKLCTTGVLREEVSLEMVERCVVETGTSTFYKLLESVVEEPLLKGIVGDIKNDEISHYNIFKSYYEANRDSENISRWEILKAIIDRIKEVESDDTKIAFKHIYEQKEKTSFTEDAFEAYSKDVTALMDKHYPHKMASKMVLQLLNLNPALEKLSLPVLMYVAKSFMFKK
ncbi:MAG: ferritin-like domain-containing protein [Campylobacterales bacterium]